MNRVAVVVPAHNEEALIGACLQGLAASTVPAEVVVVADACDDDTAAVAAAAGAEVVTVAARNVGRARAAGMRHALRNGTDGLWLATTDADSRPAPAWTGWHLAHAVAGADMVVGTVEVDDWTRWPAALGAIYERLYRAAGPSHVHGANLGCSAAAYVAAGGFRGLAADEDRDLVTRFLDAGRRVVVDPGCPVRTSARPAARAPRGFAAYLGALAAEL